MRLPPLFDDKTDSDRIKEIKEHALRFNANITEDLKEFIEDNQGRCPCAPFNRTCPCPESIAELEMKGKCKCGLLERKPVLYPTAESEKHW